MSLYSVDEALHFEYEMAHPQPYDLTARLYESMCPISLGPKSSFRPACKVSASRGPDRCPAHSAEYAEMRRQVFPHNTFE